MTSTMLVDVQRMLLCFGVVGERDPERADDRLIVTRDNLQLLLIGSASPTRPSRGGSPSGWPRRNERRIASALSRRSLRSNQPESSPSMTSRSSRYTPSTRMASWSTTAPSNRSLPMAAAAWPWPLPQQAHEASNKRRVGLGFTGLGDALVMLGLRYDGEPARAMARRISELMRDAAYEGLRRPRRRARRPSGSSTRTCTCPAAASRRGCRRGSRTRSARRGCATRICCRSRRPAPFRWPSPTTPATASSPPSPGATRKKRMPDNSFKEYAVEDHAWRLYRTSSAPTRR
ncbi:ribonucleotide reductase, barrel domain-containing protein [Ditylenchus destructor]|nr:ribonucleotide reductase, barrel domain-containing protein [Ditylenchus destructor]